MRFGGLLAVNNVNLELYPQGDRLSLINFARCRKNHGFNCLTGFYKPTGGTVYCAISTWKVYRGSKLPAWASGAHPASMCVCSGVKPSGSENLLVAQHISN